MKKIFSLAVLALTVSAAQANSFKVGPNSSSDKMDFADINTAMNSSSVNPGDTLWLDKNCKFTSEQSVSKKVVIIGTGYDVTQTNEGVVAQFSTINLKADYIELKSVYVTNYVNFYNANCVVDRCMLTNAQVCSNTAGTNTIRSSYITGQIYGYGSDEEDRGSFNLFNNLIVASSGCNRIEYLKDSDIEYNTIIDSNSYAGYNYYIFSYVSNSKIKNNILLKTNSSRYSYLFYSCTDLAIDHNVTSWPSAQTSYPENKVGYGGAVSTLFTCTGSYSDYYVLADNSPAKGYATDGGEVGCHGGMYGNVAGGRPQYVPYFSSVQVASQSSDGKLPLSVTIKIENK